MKGDGSDWLLSHSPRPDDLEVVLDSLVVDEFTLLERAHLDLLVTDPGLDGGH